MTLDRTGPPDGESRPPRGKPANVEEAATTPLITNSVKRTAAQRQCATGVRPWRRRRDGADRCAPLGEWGNVRDPWQPWRPERLSDRQLEGVVAAAGHLAAVGLTPLFDVPTLRQLRAAGHRGLADTLRGDL